MEDFLEHSYSCYAYRRIGDNTFDKIKLGENIRDKDIYNIDNHPCKIITNLSKPIGKFGCRQIFIKAINIINGVIYNKTYGRNTIFEPYFIKNLENVALIITDEIYNNDEIIDISLIIIKENHEEIINLKIIENIKIKLIKNVDETYYTNYNIDILEYNNEIWLINYNIY